MRSKRCRPGLRLDERPQVLFVTSWYPTREQPALGVFVREHAKAVRLYDHVVVVHLAGQRPGLGGWWNLEGEVDDRLTEGIPTYRLCYRRSPIPKTSFLVLAGAVLGAVRTLRGRGFRADVIHANVYNSALAAMIAARILRVPLVLTALVRISKAPSEATPRSHGSVGVWLREGSHAGEPCP